MTTSSTPPTSHRRSFASDNFAGVHPTIMEAIVEANQGHAMAYGSDAITAESIDRFKALFGESTEVFYVFGGTGGNVFGLATLCGPGDAVLCSQWSHLHVDETAAPERAGIKLIAVPSVDAKVTPRDIEMASQNLGVMHHAQPRVVSITQPTELGTLYTPEEIRAVCETAHAHGMLVHMDGARIANATAALGGVAHLRSFTVDAGIDVLTFGGTKNGLMYGEAVLYFDNGSLTGELAETVRRARRYAPFARKQATQLPSKMRFVSAQFNAALHGGLWVDLGGRANASALGLYDLVSGVSALGLSSPPRVNSLYPTVPAREAVKLRELSFFWDWDVSVSRVRWMTSWDTTPADIETFAAGVTDLLG